LSACGTYCGGCDEGEACSDDGVCVVGVSMPEPSVTLVSPSGMYIDEIPDVIVSSMGLSSGDHYHIYVDDALVTMLYDDGPYALSDLMPGTHQVTAVVVDGAHSEYWNASASASETIHFGYRGDVNLDGQFDVLDVVQLVSYVLETVIPGDLTWALCDVSQDDAVNVLDVVGLVNQVLDA